MSAKRALRRRRRTRGGAGGTRFVRDCLGRMARILVQSGHSPQLLWQEFREVCRRLKEPREPWEPGRLTDIADLPHIITHWHMDERYVDAQGKPRPLPLRGSERSLATLIERVMPGKDPVSVVQSLKRFKGVRRSKSGLYVPTARHLAWSDLSASVHCLNALSGMLRTVEHNVSGKGPYRMFERVVTNPGVPVSALPAFHRRLEPRAMNFLLPIDRELQGREKADPAGRKVRLGVGVFVFESPARRSAGDRRKNTVDRTVRVRRRSQNARRRGGR